jgi:nucleolar protein 53
MGRKLQGSSLRAKKRAQEASYELQESTAKEVETAQVIHKTDDQLFVLDTTAETVRGGIPKDETINKKKRKKGLTPAEEKQVNELLEKHDADALKKMADETKNQIERAKKQKRAAIAASYDLWDAPVDKLSDPDTNEHTVPTPSPGIGDSLAGTAPAHVSVKQRPAQKLKKKVLAVQVAHGGQSYHPDREQHQDVIGEALAMELKRKEVVIYNATPLSNGMSEKTKSLLLGSDDESDDNEDDAHDAPIEIKKRKEKLTKAERNRQKRHRALQREIEERKKAKKLVNSLSEIKRVKKDFAQKEREDKERKEMLKKLKEESERTLGKQVLQNLAQRDPIGVPTLPVALSTELQSSLRSIKPKGSLLEDRLESFRDRKMAAHKHVGDRKKIVQGKKRKVKVKGAVEHRLTTADGVDIHFMG